MEPIFDLRILGVPFFRNPTFEELNWRTRI
jgi:hypothetical protein